METAMRNGKSVNGRRVRQAAVVIERGAGDSEGSAGLWRIHTWSAPIPLGRASERLGNSVLELRELEGILGVSWLTA